MAVPIQSLWERIITRDSAAPIELNSIQFAIEPIGAILLGDDELVPNVSGGPLTVPVLGDWNGDGVRSVADVLAALTALSNLKAYEARLGAMVFELVRPCAAETASLRA